MRDNSTAQLVRTSDDTHVLVRFSASPLTHVLALTDRKTLCGRTAGRHVRPALANLAVWVWLCAGCQKGGQKHGAVVIFEAREVELTYRCGRRVREAPRTIVLDWGFCPAHQCEALAGYRAL